MIPREKMWHLFTTCIFLLVAEVKLQNGRTYDTNDWIPVTPSSLHASGSEIIEDKTANDRVLSLDAPAKQFFPDDEYEYRKRRPNQVQQFVRDPPMKNNIDHSRPRKLKHPLDYKFETPPPPYFKSKPQINYYNGQNLSPYTFEPPSSLRAPKPDTQKTQQSFYVPVQQLPNQIPNTNRYVAEPNLNPQVPAPTAQNVYDKYQLPFNATFYQSLNPASLNNEFYQAINTTNFNVHSKPKLNVPNSGKHLTPSEEESVQLVYVPVENLKGNTPNTKNYYQIKNPQFETVSLTTGPQAGQVSNANQLDQPRQEKLVFDQPFSQQNSYTKNSYQVNNPQFETVSLTTGPQASQISNANQLDQPRQEKLVFDQPFPQQNPYQTYQHIDALRQEKPYSLPEPSTNKQHRLETIEQDFVHKALQAHKFQEQLQDEINPLKQEPSTTTSKPNRKPHQPPLAVFMASQKKAEITDVLNALKGVKTISVQDSVTADSPKIFIGPSNLESPDGYTKFSLPYLNNVNGNRIERRINQLPFFVAPVSYKTPSGYSKISLPSPHVGSVVVSVPVTTSTTQEPALLHPSQINPFGYTSNSFNPIDANVPSRQQFLDNYEVSNLNENRYQSTVAPKNSEKPITEKDTFKSQFLTPQQEVYHINRNPQQTYRNTAPALDIYKPQQQEQLEHVSLLKNKQQSLTSSVPNENQQVSPHLPSINPLELAINEFELHQINNQFEQHNKVKHSTTRRPQTKYIEENESPSITRSPLSRGRHNYEAEIATEKSVTRGRVRGRGRGSSSRTVTTTTSTLAPVENDRYTILEEFVTRDPNQISSTENYGSFSIETNTDFPSRSTATPNRNFYLPMQNYENRQLQTQFDHINPTSRPGDVVEIEQPQQTSTATPNRNSYLPRQNYDNRQLQTQFDQLNPTSRPEDVVEIEQPQRTSQRSRSQTQKRPQSELEGGLSQTQPVVENENRDSIKIEKSRVQIQPDFVRFQTQNIKQADEQDISKTQTLLETENIQNDQQPVQYFQKTTEIENIPASVYDLRQPQTYDSTGFAYDPQKNSAYPTRLTYENAQTGENFSTEISETPQSGIEQSRNTNKHRFSPDIVSYENREPIQHSRSQERPTQQEYEDNTNKPLDDFAPKSKTSKYSSTKTSDQILEEQKPKQQTYNDPAGFLENLYQPNFDQTYLSLQDQAVRSLLLPNLLVPTTKQDLPSTPRTETISSTEAIIELPSSTEGEITTTTRVSRIRGRGRARQSTTSATVSSASKRTSNRRRPVSRTSTEKIAASTENFSREDSERSGSNVKPSFRTRFRPAQNEISDRISTTENDVRNFGEQTLDDSFNTFSSREPPQSYMQFEHSIDAEQIITVNPEINQSNEEKIYYQGNSIPAGTTTERQQFALEYENTRGRPTPVVDVHVTHLVHNENLQNPNTQTTPTNTEQYVRYNSNNIKSGGIINNNKPVTTTREPTTKSRVRTRGRSRFPTTTKTTSKPITRISTSSPLRTTNQEEEQENFGFIRQPAYNQKTIQAQIPVQSNARNTEPSVQFVGEIRPKYNSRRTTVPPPEESSTSRTRARTRAPLRQSSNTYRQSNNDDNGSKSAEQVTRRSGTLRGRTRGSTQFKSPEYQKRESDDEDFANQNYPVNFLQKLDASSPKPSAGTFQITIDPSDPELDDQSPHSSIYRPKFVDKPNGWSNTNDLYIERKPTHTSQEVTTEEFFETTFGTSEPQALPIVQTTESSEEFNTQFTEAKMNNILLDLEKIKTAQTEQSITTLEPTEILTTQKKTRRKGAWKLVRHRPVDPLEVSESQNYQSVLNLFDSIEKTDGPSKNNMVNEIMKVTKANSDEQISLDSINFQQEINSLKTDSPDNLYLEGQKDIEEVVTVVTENEQLNTETSTESNIKDVLTTTPMGFKTQENIFNTIYEMFGLYNKPEPKKNENVTVINTDEDLPTTTLINPVFPEEINEELSTQSSTSTEKINDDLLVKIISESNTQNLMESTERVGTTTSEIKPLTKPYEVEPWEMRAVKTSTSTEVSHETEICYKGRCVKSKEKKISRI